MAAALKELADVTECSICTEVFTNPRVLPCIHTYCLKCIQGWSKDKLPGDTLECPLCKKACTIPENGLEGLPRNFFVEKMLRVRELTSVEVQSALCNMCTYRATSETATIDVATAYCFQCQEAFCEPCANGHRKQKVTRDHKLLQIGDRVKPEELYTQYPPANCDKHVDEALKIYCNECKLVICMMCYIKEHNSHKCSDIHELLDEFRKQMKNDVSGVANDVDKCQQLLQQLTMDKKNFHEQVSKCEQEIRDEMKQLKQMIDMHEELFLAELKSTKQKRTKEIEAAYQEVECHVAAKRSYAKFVHEMLEKGTACEIARAASGLRHRADELLMSDVIKRTLTDLGHAEVTFQSSNFVTDDAKNTIGQIQYCATPRSPPTVTHVIPGRTGVYAVASLDDRVYVVREEKKEVEVYDAMTLTIQQRLPVSEISHSPSGIAACFRCKCLFLSNWKKPSIHRLDPATQAVKTWKVPEKPEGLSINGDHNLLVACVTSNKLQEYTTDGCLVKEICLTADFGGPWHAIQLSTGDYVVSHDQSPGVVSVVGVDGQLIRSYGPSSSSDVGRMGQPRSLAVTKQGDILVADQGNNRILAINSSLARAQPFPLPSDIDLRQPCALYLDETRDRLYVGEISQNCRVIVLNKFTHWLLF